MTEQSKKPVQNLMDPVVKVFENMEKGFDTLETSDDQWREIIEKLRETRCHLEKVPTDGEIKVLLMTKVLAPLVELVHLDSIGKHFGEEPKTILNEAREELLRDRRIIPTYSGKIEYVKNTIVRILENEVEKHDPDASEQH